MEVCRVEACFDRIPLFNQLTISAFQVARKVGAVLSELEGRGSIPDEDERYVRPIQKWFKGFTG